MTYEGKARQQGARKHVSTVDWDHWENMDVLFHATEKQAPFKACVFYIRKN